MIFRGEPWGELWVMTAPGAPRLTQDDETFLRAIADQLVGAIHRAELFAQIEALAYTDSLTGLASRRAVETRARGGLRRRPRAPARRRSCSATSTT